MYEEDIPHMYGQDFSVAVPENDAIFDMSEPSRLEREFRWLQLLNPDQRRQYFSLFWFYG